MTSALYTVCSGRKAAIGISSTAAVISIRKAISSCRVALIPAME